MKTHGRINERKIRWTNGMTVGREREQQTKIEKRKAETSCAVKWNRNGEPGDYRHLLDPRVLWLLLLPRPPTRLSPPDLPHYRQVNSDNLI